ncbi:MAG: hypothetical protein KAI64_06440, partial [Thermoplasmata archaeon]|nr:hypothetical protein [Thermoplasmata archaeon]
MANSYTTNLNLAKPAKGDVDWDDEINGNMDILDTAFGAEHESDGSHTYLNPENVLRVGVSGCPYTSVQTALNAASSGDIVLVYPGTYDERVVIGDGVSLVGVHRDSCVISNATTSQTLVTMNSNSCISNLTLEITGMYNNGVVTSDNCVIKNCKISAEASQVLSSTMGVKIGGPNQTVRIRSCEIFGQYHGVYCTPTYANVNLYLDNSEITSAFDALSLGPNGGDLYIKNCRLVSTADHDTCGSR